MKINSRETHRKSLVHVFSDRISCIIKPLNNVSPVSSIQCHIYKRRRNNISCFHFFKRTLTSYVILLWKERAEKFHFLVSLLNLLMVIYDSHSQHRQYVRKQDINMINRLLNRDQHSLFWSIFQCLQESRTSLHVLYSNI